MTRLRQLPAVPMDEGRIAKACGPGTGAELGTLPTLVVGIGNPTRQDDGAGIILAQKIADLGPPGIEVQTAQQLAPETAADWADRRRVLVIDAAVTGPEIDLRRLENSSTCSPATASHAVDPGVVSALARRLYGRSPEVWLCTLRAESLAFGDTLTPSMLQRLETAQNRLMEWLVHFS